MKNATASLENQQRILFDHKRYRKTYMGGPATFEQALRHFIPYGYRAGFRPHLLFDVEFYLRQLPVGEPFPENPLIHYIEKGAAMGMNPCPLFDPEWYEARYDVAETGLTPLAHYIRFGVPRHHDPNAFFDAAAYESKYPEEIAACGGYALLHYFFTANTRLQDPSDRFSTRAYLESHPEAARGNVNALLHFMLDGRAMPRNFSWPLLGYETVRLEDLVRLRHTPKNGVVVYTSVTGGYSRLLPPVYIHPAYEYVCFTDDLARENWGVWDLRPVPYTDTDSVRMARYAKLHPHVLFPQAEWAIWTDANIVIAGDMSPLIEETRKSGAPIGLMRHPWRDCAYQEAEECIRDRRDSEETIRNQMEEYRAAGFPEKTGLMESNVYVANLRHPQTVELFTMWWAELSRHSRRDQLSLPYVLHSLGIIPHYLGEPGVCARNHESFIWLLHVGTDDVEVPPEYGK